MNVRRAAKDDAGFTLVELMVYGILLVIVVGVAGGIIINTLGVSKDVRTSNEATSTGQLVATSISTAIRQASWVKVVALTNAQFVTARTTTGTATIAWQCEAWYFDSTNGGAIYTTSSSTKITQPTGTPTGWTLLAKGVQVGTGALFAINPVPVPLPNPTSTGKGLTVDLKMTADGTTIPIQSTTISRQSSVESAPCS